MDLSAVKAATRPELVAGAAAAARNASGLVRDAEVLAELHCQARAYALAALAVEEAGKAINLITLAVMPESLKAQAPVRRMLEWHQLKQAIGQFIGLMPYGSPGLATRLVTMPAADLVQILSAVKVPAEEADRLKRGGLYVDIGRGGLISEPSEITEIEVARQLALARRSAGTAVMMLGPDEQARFADPCPEAVELSRAAVSVLAEAGYARTPDAAADVIVKMISKLRERVAGTSQRLALGA